METAVYQEKCVPSEATPGKSDSDMAEFSCLATCKNYSKNVSYYSLDHSVLTPVLLINYLKCKAHEQTSLHELV